MSRSTQYAIPAVALAFLLVLAAFLVLPPLLATAPPPSPAGRWVADRGPAGARLGLLEGGRLGPSVISASACREYATSPADEDLWEVADGTWNAAWETDAGHQVHIEFTQPRKCRITLANRVEKDGGHTLWYSRFTTELTLMRP
ncbi:hypothetical protein ABTX81_15355 [Kitasatospora sp. NPDC097605]|uniref:hypothetical protein n=1 Tax=Kitasatospora sp. NPDC097605 TaxID=3157226 RepID=UPI0033259D00